jgi:polysaccharide export outer membrane protein
MLAKAGGVAIEPEIAIVRVTRGRQTGKVWLQDLWANPGARHRAAPRRPDRDRGGPARFTALGATGSQAWCRSKPKPCRPSRPSPSWAGCRPSTADPTGVFVFRNEQAEIANAVLGRNDLQGDQRMVYVLDLTQPTGMFEARDFLVRDGDTVYVTEAPFVQWSKTLSAITGASGAADSLATTATGG